MTYITKRKPDDFQIIENPFQPPKEAAAQKVFNNRDLYTLIVRNAAYKTGQMIASQTLESILRRITPSFFASGRGKLFWSGRQCHYASRTLICSGLEESLDSSIAILEKALVRHKTYKVNLFSSFSQSSLDILRGEIYELIISFKNFAKKECLDDAGISTVKKTLNTVLKDHTTDMNIRIAAAHVLQSFEENSCINDLIPNSRDDIISNIANSLLFRETATSTLGMGWKDHPANWKFVSFEIIDKLAETYADDELNVLAFPKEGAPYDTKKSAIRAYASTQLAKRKGLDMEIRKKALRNLINFLEPHFELSIRELSIKFLSKLMKFAEFHDEVKQALRKQLTTRTLTNRTMIFSAIELARHGDKKGLFYIVDTLQSRDSDPLSVKAPLLRLALNSLNWENIKWEDFDRRLEGNLKSSLISALYEMLERFPPRANDYIFMQHPFMQHPTDVHMLAPALQNWEHIDNLIVYTVETLERISGPEEIGKLKKYLREGLNQVKDRIPGDPVKQRVLRLGYFYIQALSRIGSLDEIKMLKKINKESIKWESRYGFSKNQWELELNLAIASLFKKESNKVLA